MSFSRRSFLAGGSAFVLASCGPDEIKSQKPSGLGSEASPFGDVNSSPGAPTKKPESEVAPASFGQPFDSSATSLDPYLSSIVSEIVLFNAKNHDYFISLVEASASQFQAHIWDEQIGERVAYFRLLSPNYNDLPERIALVPRNPLAGAKWSGLEGWIKLNAENIVPSPARSQFNNPAQSRINRANVSTRNDYENRDRLDEFEEIIPVGPGREHTTIRSALESLYDDGPLADQANPAQLPTCARANPFHRIALVFDPGVYTGVSEHVPDWVYLVGRIPNTVVLEHTPGATRALIEGQANTGAYRLTIRNNVPNGSGPARYAWHTDYVHGVQVPDTEGDINRNYGVYFEQVRFVVGPQAQIQAYGSGIGVQASAQFLQCDFDCENPAYSGILASANNSSGTIGGGRFTFESCRDLSNRDVPSIGVQTKTNSTYPNIVEVKNCPGFNKISLAAGSLGDFKGKWVLHTNQPMEVISTIPGDNLTGP